SWYFSNHARHIATICKWAITFRFPKDRHTSPRRKFNVLATFSPNHIQVRPTCTSWSYDGSRSAPRGDFLKGPKRVNPKTGQASLPIRNGRVSRLLLDAVVVADHA